MKVRIVTQNKFISRRNFVLGAATGTALVASPANAQFGLGNVLGGGANLLRGLGINKWLEGDAPVTTALTDAQWGDASRDGFSPAPAAQSLTALNRTDNGGFILRAGYWRFTAQSYCLHAGTHGPGSGNGYLYAPLEGSAEQYVRDILRNSVDHPNIPQRQIQTLIWAILARAKFEDLRREHQLVAAQLLSRRQLSRLNRSAMDLVPSGAMSRIMPDIPGPLRSAFRTEAALRRGLTVGGASFSQLESIAVLGGEVPLGEGSQDIPSGRWSNHPDGYAIRYYPSGYSQTVQEIWVAEGSAGVGAEYDPALQVAVPGNTSRQRLAQSGRQKV